MGSKGRKCDKSWTFLAYISVHVLFIALSPLSARLSVALPIKCISQFFPLPRDILNLHWPNQTSAGKLVPEYFLLYAYDLFLRRYVRSQRRCLIVLLIINANRSEIIIFNAALN